MTRFLYLAFAVLLCLPAHAQQKYDVALIPRPLLSYAGAVVRNSETTVEVNNSGTYTYRVKTAITILNSNGDDAAEILVWYDKLWSVKSIKGALYDDKGYNTGKFSERNFADYYAGNDFSLFEDNRVKQYTPPAQGYPYTIEYELEVRTKQTLYFPDWVPGNTTNTAVQKSVYTFTCDPQFDINYKEFNLAEKGKVVITPKGDKIYTWKVENLKATKPEPYSVRPENFLAMVKVAPKMFKYDNITGSFNDWNQLGKWMYDKLLIGRDVLNPETVAYIHKITDSIADPKLKARKVYEYMQKKTRYISVQIGIGGYQPYPAADVDRLSYGDCKALVNYTQALLKAVDIESYYCIVNAGAKRLSLDTGFASMTQANHIILCLPFKNDTTFLECTSKTMPFGYLGDFTDDRVVLACTPQGGKLMHTPKYPADESLQTRTAKLIINQFGELSGSMQTLYNGVQYDNMQHLIGESPADRIKGYKKVYNINNFEISKLELVQDKGIKPQTKEDITFNALRFASVTKDRLYFMPNLANRRASPLRDVRNRYSDVFIPRGFTDVDEITYDIPPGYQPDKKPLMISIENQFGTYSATAFVLNNKLVYKRRLQLLDGVYSKDIYPDMVAFFQAVVDADNYNMIFTKQQDIPVQ